MSAFVRCPECDRRFRSSSTKSATIRCPYCDAVVDADDMDRDEEVRPKRRRAQPSNTNTFLILGLVGCGLVGLVCAVGIGIAFWLMSPNANKEVALEMNRRMAEPFAPPFQEQTEDYDQARRHFQTKLVRQKPAPQEWQHEQPPAGVREVPYRSGDLRLRAWVSGPPQDGRRRPAVLFLHGGFAFGADDWEQTEPFRDAGFAVMTPTLRGENGLPGSYSMFYNEVEDVLGAADALAKLSYVDSNRLYVAGHSVGGTLAMLAAMTSDRFRAAASFSGSPDQASWSRLQPELIPFDSTDQREFQMRSPLAFPKSFKCPVRIYYGSQELFFAANSQRTAQLAKAAGRDVEALSVPGNHLSMVQPAMQQAIAFFQQK